MYLGRDRRRAAHELRRKPRTLEPTNRLLLAILVCVVVGAIVGIGMGVVLHDSTGFLADNRAAVTGAMAGLAAVLIVKVVVPRGGKQK